MAKRRVRVRLIAEAEVEIVVDAAEDEDPRDLTPEEQSKAESLGPSFPQWRFQRRGTEVVE